MKTAQTFFDKAAISLSTLCVIHCLLVPIALSMNSALLVLPLEGELFHQLLVFLVLPTSLIGLTLGCKKHKNWQIFLWGLTGLVFVVVAILLGHHLLGEFGEKTLTTIGSVLIAWSHFKNYQRCRLKQC